MVVRVLGSMRVRRLACFAALAAWFPAPAATAQPAQRPQAAPVAPPLPAPQPVRVETTRHGGWALTCQDFTEPKPRRTCQGLIQVGQPNTNQVLFTWLMARGDDGRIVNTLQTLPGVSIPQGISFRVGKGTARPVPFATCEPTHCTGTFVADDAFLREAETAETAEALVVGSNGRGVQFKIDAKGVERIVAALRR